MSQTPGDLQYKVVAFDFASFKFGLAVGQYPEKEVVHVCKVDTPIEEYPALSDADRADLLVDRALDIIREHNPKRVIVEDHRISYGRKNRGYQEYYCHGNLRILARYCQKKGIEFEFVMNSSMKKIVLGIGRGEKWQVIRAMNSHFNLKLDPIKDEDAGEAGAFLLADFLTH